MKTWLALLVAVLVPLARAQTPAEWKAHDMARPRPPVVRPAPEGAPTAPPSDAIVLFDGTDLSQWRADDGGPSRWVVRGGAMESVPGSGYVFTRRNFGDMQLHVEWAAPTPAQGSGQGRGNSGVFPMGLYEIQVLDSYGNVTYADGQAGAVYGQYPPLANASRPAGEWQSFDVVFRRPRFARTGALAQPARVTVLHNGVLVHDGVEIWGPTNWLQHTPYTPHPDRLPLALQDHGNPVRFRNIWVRELAETTEPGPAVAAVESSVTLTSAQLDAVTGRYRREDDAAKDPIEVRRDGNRLLGNFSRNNWVELVPESPTEFHLRWTAAQVVFSDGGGRAATRLTFRIGGETRTAVRVP